MLQQNQNKDNPLITNQIFFGCDMLEFEIKDIEKDLKFKDYGIDLEKSLNQTNTHNAYIELFNHIFVYRITRTKGGNDLIIYTTSIDSIPVDCFYIIIGKKNSFGSKNKNRVGFYSSFFILEYMNKLDLPLSEFFSFLFPKYAKLYRIDIALDISNTIKHLNETIFLGTRFFSQIGEDKKHPEFSQTYYIKNPQSSQNRSYIFRIYDKVLDTFKKGKGFLYPHLKNNPDVRRIELELRPKECELYADYTMLEFLENKNDILQKIFVKYLNKNINENHLIDYNSINCYKHYNKITDLKKEFLQLGHIPNDYLSRAHGYIKNIKENIGYFGLFDMLLKVQKESIENIKTKTTDYQSQIMKHHGYNINKKITLKNRNILNSHELLENLILYIQKNNLSERKTQQILKKYITKPKIKLGKK